MKNRKKIWLAVVLFAVIESFAFPEILFPDCIEEYTADKYPMCKREQKKEGMVKYHFSSFFLDYLKKPEK